MIHPTLNIGLSAIDEDRFGIRAARASGITLEHLPTVIDFCQQNDVKFLIARCPVHEISTVQAMGEQGFSLMDTLLYFSRRLASAPLPPLSDGQQIRPVRVAEAQEISDLAIQTFRGYGGHYHADSRLDRQKCDEVYASWAYRSCVSREVADEVLVAEREGKVAGFITLKIHNSEEGEGPLYGVDSGFQGHGVGRDLMIAAMRWFESRGIAMMMMSTQITNLPSQKVWVRLGFEPTPAQYTFHKWFD